MLNRSFSTRSRKFGAVIIVSAAATVLGVTGCSSAQPAKSSENPAVSATAMPTATHSPGAIADGQSVGDGVEVSMVTDSLGTYAHIGLSPKAKAATFDARSLDPASTKGLFSDAELASAQKWVSGFIAAQTLDSSALDIAANYPAWSAEAQNDSVAASGSALLGTGTDGTYAITWNAAGANIVPQLIRDGGPRMRNVHIGVTKVYPFTDAGPGSAIAIFANSEADYRVSDKSARAYLKARHPTYSAETLKEKTIPALYDNAGENSFPVRATLVYSVVPSNAARKIAGVKVSYVASVKWLR